MNYISIRKNAFSTCICFAWSVFVILIRFLRVEKLPICSKSYNGIIHVNNIEM